MRVHLIGIGGIGVSALAKYYLEKGYKVSGSDLVSSEITEALKDKGVKIFIGPHKPQCLTSDVKQVIYSPAVPENNPELKKAKKLGIKCKSYPQALGELTKKHWTIAISGTHGKGTTTAMISLILIKAGLDPTVIIGTKLREFEDSNCRVGKSKYLVIEADEWKAAFLNYWPKIIILTNIEREHMDYFKDLNHILKTYQEYILHLPKNGILIANKDDKNIPKLLKISTIVKNISCYSLQQKEAKRLERILKIPGEHNVSNALAALTVARILKIPDEISFEALSEYKGAWRRFEIKQSTINNQQLTIISDYAHHPTEIKVTLKAARERFSGRKIWVVFQPHQYQRTYYLFKEFVKVFNEALQKGESESPLIDKVIITDIYDVAGREEKKIKEKINSEKLIKAIKSPKALYISTFEEVAEYLKKNLLGEEVVVIMGAGSIYKLVDFLG